MSISDYIYPTKIIKQAAKSSSGTDLNFWVCLGSISKHVPMAYLLVKDFLIIVSWYTFVFVAEAPQVIVFFAGIIFSIILFLDYFLIKAKKELKKSFKR